MVKSLRGRLLSSYVFVIATVLVITGLALILVVGSPLGNTARLLPTLQNLQTISRASARLLTDQVGAATSREDLATMLDGIAQTEDVRILAFDTNTQTVIYDSQDQWLATSLESFQVNEIQDLNVVNSPFTGAVVAPDNTRWLATSHNLAAREIRRVIVVYMRAQPTFLQFFRVNFLTPLCQAGCAAFLLSILLAWLITRSVSRPLQNMATAAENIASGQFEQHLALDGPEEVKRVARSFNRMSSQVQTTQQSQRDFVANVSHDLKTPLTAIRGWSQAMLDGMVSEPAEQQRAATIINTEAERMQRLVNQLLDLARIESGQLQLANEPIDLAELLGQVHHNLLMRAEEKALYFDLDMEPVPTIWGDHDRLMQVFTNLADNAIKHTPAGGRVQLQLRATPGGDLLAAVRDNGSGIESTELSRIFERFYQVDKARSRPQGAGRSAGLGLAIVRELVEAHGGTITARSRPGAGSEFEVRLPSLRSG
ncbi:MAG: HAMP domain-containing protein [Anaerolineales bacterium]|nr:HAMP domain-containing protein [Anaerolineales bacterium]